MELMNSEINNDNRVGEMIEQMNNCPTCAMIYLLKYYDKNNTDLYGYTEGETDIPYYRSKFEPVAQCKGVDVKFKSCGNKQNVKELYDFVEASPIYDNSRIFFFMDRDFSDVIDDPYIVNADNVYITDGYSFENDILNESTFELTLKEVIGMDQKYLDKTKKNITSLVSNFNNAKEQFIELMLPITANIIHWKKNGIKSRGYKNFSIEKNIIINGNNVTWSTNINPVDELYNKSQIDKTYKNCTQTESIIKEIKQKKLEHHTLRGHYYCEFFCKYCNTLVEKGLSLISENDISKNISIRAKAPNSLIEFINKALSNS